MQVLLSIKPKYVRKIFNRTKLFEFRKAIFKDPRVREVIIYSSSPEQKIVGSFNIGQIIEKPPEMLWEACEAFAGIQKEEFFKYFQNKTKGYAIEITDLKEFKQTIDPKHLIPDFHPPQSYCYLNDIEVEGY